MADIRAGMIGFAVGLLAASMIYVAMNARIVQFICEHTP